MSSDDHVGHNGSSFRSKERQHEVQIVQTDDLVARSTAASQVKCKRQPHLHNMYAVMYDAELHPWSLQLHFGVNMHPT